jgi:hypothetical protein
MQGTVAPAVAATIAAVAAGPAGGDRDGRGAVGGGEVVGVREAGHRPDLTQDPGGQDGTDADQVDQPGVAGRDQRGQLAGELTDLTVEFAEPHDAAAGESGPHRWLVGEELLGGGQGALGGQPPADLAAAGADDGKVGVQPVAFGMAQRQQFVAVVAEHLEILGQAGLADRGEVGVTGTAAGDRQRIGRVGLPGRRSRRRSRTVSAPGTSPRSTLGQPGSGPGRRRG